MTATATIDSQLRELRRLQKDEYICMSVRIGSPAVLRRFSSKSNSTEGSRGLAVIFTLEAQNSLAQK